ncbi:hypothetical protein [Massilia sp. TWR1-2-2]|uniref:hypothetical protein n=1 Tax=Massilia sp. TWR1-2-2 TaxID=2804584 RepID=UPI003CEE18F8
MANLAQIRKLKAEPSSPREFDGLLRSAVERATDAHNAGLSLASRFTLAYDASHALALALAALRAHGYRSEDRDQSGAKIGYIASSRTCTTWVRCATGPRRAITPCARAGAKTPSTRA